MIATLSATDPDLADTFSYSIQPGGDAGMFSIHGAAPDELVFDGGILDFEGTNTFSIVVQVTDSASNVYNEAITVNVTDINESPNAADDFFAIGLPTAINAPGVLANDSDPDGDALSVSLVTPPTHGSLILNPEGTFFFAPDSGYLGNDSFVYSVSDGITAPSQATVNISVLPIAIPAIPSSSPSSNDSAPATSDDSNSDEDSNNDSDDSSSRGCPALARLNSVKKTSIFLSQFAKQRKRWKC